MNVEETKYKFKSPHQNKGRNINVRTAMKFFENLKNASFFGSLTLLVAKAECSTPIP
jgi:hypothetical protein